VKAIIQINPIASKAFRFSLLVAIAILSFSCSRKVAFDVSTVEPAAQGTVKVNRDKNENYQIDLDVIRLAEPERLTPPKRTYVVWMETTQDGTKNLGQLKSSEALFSRNLRSSLGAVTPYEPVSFFITAEEEGDGSSPTGTVVLRTGRLRR